MPIRFVNPNRVVKHITRKKYKSVENLLFKNMVFYSNETKRVEIKRITNINRNRNREIFKQLKMKDGNKVFRPYLPSLKDI